MSTPLIYICEDDPSLGQMVMMRLQQEGYRCRLFYDPEEMDECSRTDLPDLLLLDVQLPGESGLSIAQRYQRAVPGLRVIMMSVLAKPRDILTGYDAGAMMYLPKPFTPESLVACLHGLFGKPDPHEVASTPILKLESHRLYHAEGLVQLTVQESSVLSFLAIRQPYAVEYYELMCNSELEMDIDRKNTLEVLVSRIRQKLKAIPGQSVSIKTKRNFGYELLGQLVVE